MQICTVVTLYDPSSVMCYTAYPDTVGFVMERATT